MKHLLVTKPKFKAPASGMAFIGASTFGLGAATVHVADIYYAIDKPGGRAGFVVVWAEGACQWALLPVATICQNLSIHAKSIGANSAAIGARAVAAILDPANCPENMSLEMLLAAVALQIDHSKEHFKDTAPNSRCLSA